MKAIGLITFLFLVSKIEADDASNKIVDGVIDLAKKMIVEKHVEPVSLPDIHEKFDAKITKLNADMTNGKLTGLTSMARSGDSTVSSNDGKYLVATAISLNDVKAGYDIHASGFGINLHGDIKVTADNGRIDIRAFACPDGKCETTISRMKITQIDYHFHVDGITGFDWLVQDIIDVVSDVFKSDINKMIEDELKKVAKDAIDKIIHELH